MGRVQMKHAVPQRRGPVPITRHDEQHSLVAKRSIRRDDGPARPDSDVTVQYVLGTSSRPLP